MGDYSDYLKLCLKQTLRVWELSQSTGGLIGAIISAAIAAFWVVGLEITLAPAVGTWIALFLGIWLVVLFIFVSPYRLYKSERSKRITLEEDARPRLTLGSTVFEHSDNMDDEDDCYRIMYIEVTNQGNKTLKEYLVKVVSVENARQGRRIYQSALRTEARRWDEFVGRFKLGPMETKRVVLTSYDALDETHPEGTVLATERRGIPLHREQEYQVELIAIGDEGHPAAKTVTLFVDEWNNVIDRSAFSPAPIASL